MKRTIIALAAFLLCLLTIQAAQAEVVNRIAAIVNDEIITLYEVQNEAQQMLLMYRQQNGLTEEQAESMRAKTEREILTAKIRDKLFEHEVAKLGVPVSDKDIDDYIDYILSRSNLTIPQLREMLRREGKTMSEYRDMVTKKIQREQYVQYRVKSGTLDITEEDIRNYYNLHTQEFLMEQEVEMQEIRFHLNGGDEQALFARADKVYRLLLAGEPFDELAKAHSDSGSASSGGNLGWFKMNTELKPAYSWVAQSLEVGAFSTPQRDGVNLFILRLVTRKDAVPKPFEDVKKQINTILYNRKVEMQIDALTDELYRKSLVDIRIDMPE